MTDVRKINVQIQKSEIDSTAATKDMQDVHAHVAVNWSMAIKDVLRTYKEIGDQDAVLARIIDPSVNEVMKAATARRTAEEVLTKRMEMKTDIDNGLKDRLAQYGIHFNDVSIVNLKFSPEFTRAIEQKQIAEQQAKQAEYVALKATQEAKAEVERAKGQAAAQTLMKTTITPQILQQRAIEKWDGHFPQIVSNGVMPFIDFKMK